MLFDEKQKYIYAVSEKTLLTDKGKSLFRAYQRSYNAQEIFKELSNYALTSTKASMDASSLLTYITTTHLGDGKWKGTTHAFILHWQDQIRKYHDLAPKQKLPLDLQRTMLENAVHPIASLRIVKTQAEQHKTHTGTDLTYSQYCTLLLSAAQQHDKTLMAPSSKPNRRQVYASEQDFGECMESSDFYSIDSPIDTLNVHQTVTNKPKPPRLTRDQWYCLTEEAKQTWDLLSDEAKAIILRPSTHSQSHPPPPKRRVNAHELEHLLSCLSTESLEPPTSTLTSCFHAQSEGSNDQMGQEVTSVPEEQPDNNLDDVALLAHLTKRKTLPPGNVRRLLSPTAGKKSQGTSKETSQKHQLNREINMAQAIYQVSASAVKQKPGALVDRGANGGVAGADVRVIATTDRHVDIQGIDNHRMTDVPIVTAGMVVNTQKGEVIAILHQYAYTGKGKTIHSSGQLEAFKQDVYDKSVKVGGKQQIETPDGYVIPLNFRNGLPYLSMRPYNNAE
jgi:hypothetical protein